MKARHTFFAGLTSGLAVAAIAFAAGSGRSDAAERDLNVRWEYTFSDARAGSLQLNKLGEQRWEAYAINPEFQVALKRKKYRQ